MANSQVYKVHGSPDFFPTSEMWAQISSPTLKLILTFRPKSKLLVAYLSFLELVLPDTIKKWTKPP